MKAKEILEKELYKIKAGEKEVARIKDELDSFLEFLKRRIKKLRIKADVFLGGSFAKGTIIKKKKYDVDIFVRFKKIDEAKKKFEKIFTRYRNFKVIKIHGSRDYFQLHGKNVDFEIIPVKKIKKSEEAENVTDLSFLHVAYVNKKLAKNKKLANEILLAKAFCHSQNCYGAESYISGFSGYALELLIIYYKSFENFLRRITKVKARNKIIIDIEKKYKNKNEVLMEINEAKLLSPIILVDPTFKQRNVLAALSQETFEKFKNSAEKFLRKPSIKFFERKKLDVKKYNFCLEARTNRQEGDVAGSKLLKFHNFLKREIEKHFFVKKENFEYVEGKRALSCFSLKRRKERIIVGPEITSIENVVKFKKKHKNCFVKKNRVYAREKININSEKFLAEFKKQNKQAMKDMGIVKIKRLR